MLHLYSDRPVGTRRLAASEVEAQLQHTRRAGAAVGSDATPGQPEERSFEQHVAEAASTASEHSMDVADAGRVMQLQADGTQRLRRRQGHAS